MRGLDFKTPGCRPWRWDIFGNSIISSSPSQVSSQLLGVFSLLPFQMVPSASELICISTCRRQPPQNPYHTQACAAPALSHKYSVHLNLQFWSGGLLNIISAFSVGSVLFRQGKAHSWPLNDIIESFVPFGESFQLAFGITLYFPLPLEMSERRGAFVLHFSRHGLFQPHHG